MLVNVAMYSETKQGASEPSYTTIWMTDLEVDKSNGIDSARCGRARWKIENETFNTLKTNGYHFEHNFGVARAADDASISQSGAIAGTPMYMAPEQANGETLDQRADLFSLGSVLYQMAAGRPPFRANGTLAVLKRVAEDAPRPIREIIPETPQWLCGIIAKLHPKKPEDRFQSAREVADVLDECEGQLRENTVLKDFSRIP